MELRGSMWGEWVKINSWTGISGAFCTGLHEMLAALYEFDKWTRLEIHTKQVHISLNREK